MLPTCVTIGHKPEKDMLDPIKNEGNYNYDRDKPYGGLWASTLDIEYGTDWLRCCHKDMGGVCQWHSKNSERGSQAWMIQPKENARILYIECDEDYEITTELYPLDTGRICGMLDGTYKPILLIDWEEVAKEYDVVYIEAWEYVRSWDCETILFLNWGAIEYFEKHDFVQKKLEKLRNEGRQ